EARQALLSNRQGYGTVQGTDQTNAAAHQIQIGIDSAANTANFGSISTQYKYVSGSLYKATVPIKTLKDS
ncbi:hypothetical protein FBU30_001907, partial [Linnemannia zychae]